MPAWFYILRLCSGTLYPGATENIEERYKAHLKGKACRTTSLDPPVALIYSEKFETFAEAKKREAQIKRWTRAKKEALVVEDTVKLISPRTHFENAAESVLTKTTETAFTETGEGKSISLGEAITNSWQNILALLVVTVLLFGSCYLLFTRMDLT